MAKSINGCQPWGYETQSDSLVPLLPNTNYVLRFGEPAGHVSMPFKDYVKFVQINLKGLRQDNQYLKKSTFEFLHFANKSFYSIGWINQDDENRKISEHKGSAGYFKCYAIIYPRSNLAYIVMTNTNDDELVYEAKDLLRSRLK